MPQEVRETAQLSIYSCTSSRQCRHPQRRRRRKRRLENRQCLKARNTAGCQACWAASSAGAVPLAAPPQMPWSAPPPPACGASRTRGPPPLCVRPATLHRRSCCHTRRRRACRQTQPSHQRQPFTVPPARRGRAQPALQRSLNWRQSLLRPARPHRHSHPAALGGASSGAAKPQTLELSRSRSRSRSSEPLPNLFRVSSEPLQASSA